MKVFIRAAVVVVLVAALALTFLSFGGSGSKPTARQMPSSAPSASRSVTVADSRHPACLAAAASIPDLITTLQSIATSTSADLVSQLTKERAGISAAVAKNPNDPATPALKAIANAATGILDLQRVNPKGDFTPVVTATTDALSASTKACAA